MKQLLLISTSFPDAAYQAGQEAAGQFVYDFAVSLARRARVTAVVPGQQSGVTQEDGVTVRRFGVPALPLSLLKPARPTDWGKIWRTMRAGQTAVAAAVQASPPDHILALWALPSGYWAQKTGRPYSIWALGSDIWGLGRVPLARGALRRVLQGAVHRFADGYQLAADVEAIGQRPCRFLPSSRRLPARGEKQLATQPPYKLAFLGRWHPNKGVDLLLDALHLLLDEDWRQIAEVRIFGGGPLADVVTAEVERLRANGRPVALGGYLNRREAADLLTWADYLLLPSRIESIPVIFSDALQANTPLIAAPVGDLPRLLADGAAGILAEGVSAAALAAAVRRGLGQPPVSFGDGLAALQAQFDVEETAARLAAQIL
ncbi:MAG TPA: glycosyltransferase [Anaerolineae bacterium]|nr:glycosyltransferase [Anaerolineae bacterium]